MLTYTGSVKGLRAALRASRKVVMRLGTDKLSDPAVQKCLQKEFRLAETIDYCRRKNGVIA